MAARMQLQLMAILLQRGAALDHISSGLTFLAILVGLSPVFEVVVVPLALWTAAVILLLGIVEKYWAQRVAIDAELFKVLAAEAQNLEHVVLQLDTALCDLGLATDKAEERSIAQRCQGALGLLRRQIICLGAQITLVVMAAIALAWLP